MNTGRESLSIKEFHKNKYAFCSENTGLAHNIFKILGIDSQFVIGKEMMKIMHLILYFLKDMVIAQQYYLIHHIQ